MNSFLNYYKDKNLRVGIISSIIASFIFINIQYIFTTIWNFLTVVSENTYTNYIDNIYVSASLGQRNWIDFVIFFIIIIASFITIVGRTITLHFKSVKLISKVELSKQIKGIEFEEKTDSQKIIEIKNRIKQQEENTDKAYLDLKKSMKYYLPINISIIVVLLLFSISLIFSSYADLQLNTSFNRRISALAPYISEQKVKIYRSKWALMKSRKDYLNINLEMEKESKELHLVLPQNLLD